MDWKWLRQAQMFEANAGGDPAPAAGSNQDGEIKTESTVEPPEPPGGEAVEPTPPPAPGPAATPPAEPAEPDFPEALNSLFNPQPGGSIQHQGQPPAAPQETGQPPTTPPAPAPAAPAPSADLILSDPEEYHRQNQAYMQAQINAGIERAIGEVNRSNQKVDEISRQMNADRAESVNRAHKQAESAVRGYWKNVFSRDADFRGDPELQAIVQDIIGYYSEGALQRAYGTGDTSALNAITDPIFAKRALALAKAEKTIPSPAMRPGHTPVPGQPPQPAQPSKIDEEHSEALRAAKKDGWNYTEDEIAAALKARGR